MIQTGKQRLSDLKRATVPKTKLSRVDATNIPTPRRRLNYIDQLPVTSCQHCQNAPLSVQSKVSVTKQQIAGKFRREPAERKLWEGQKSELVQLAFGLKV